MPHQPLDPQEFYELYEFVKQNYDDAEREFFGVQVRFFRQLLEAIDEWPKWRAIIPAVPLAKVYRNKHEMLSIFERVDERIKSQSGDVYRRETAIVDA